MTDADLEIIAKCWNPILADRGNCRAYGFDGGVVQLRASRADGWRGLKLIVLGHDHWREQLIHEDALEMAVDRGDLIESHIHTAVQFLHRDIRRRRPC